MLRPCVIGAVGLVRRERVSGSDKRHEGDLPIGGHATPAGMAHWQVFGLAGASGFSP